MTAHRGSVLVMALWIIAILSVMVVSFAFEARQQAGIDVYVRERNRVRRIIDSGRVLGEAVLLGYKDAPEPEIKSGAPDWDDAFEDDRWVVEKHDLKTDHKCTIGPIRLDEEDPGDPEADAPTVTVELKFESATSKIDINSLTDEKGFEIFKTILRNSGIDDELEVEVEDAGRSGSKRHNLLNLLVASWKDWRDEDDTVSRGPFESDSDYNYEPQDDDGAEKSWYEERDEEDEIPVKDRRVPANGPIKQLEELSYIRGFRDFPSVLTGGRLYDGTEQDGKRDKRGKRDRDKEDESNPTLTGIMDNFKVSGGMKIELNDETREKDLKIIFGPLFDPEDSSSGEDLDGLVSAILMALKTMPEDDDDVDETRSWWPFKDFSDLQKRVDDIGYSEKVPEEIKEYIRWPGESASTSSSSTTEKDKKSTSSESEEKFSMTIIGESMGMKYVVTARCVVADKKVKYIEWSENESTK